VARLSFSGDGRVIYEPPRDERLASEMPQGNNDVYIILYNIYHDVYKRWFRENETIMNILVLISLLYFRTIIIEQRT